MLFSYHQHRNKVLARLREDPDSQLAPEWFEIQVGLLSAVYNYRDDKIWL